MRKYLPILFLFLALDLFSSSEPFPSDLVQAILDGDIEQVADSLNDDDFDPGEIYEGKMLLTLAIEKGNVEIIKLLLKNPQMYWDFLDFFGELSSYINEHPMMSLYSIIDRDYFPDLIKTIVEFHGRAKIFMAWSFCGNDITEIERFFVNSDFDLVELKALDNLYIKNFINGHSGQSILLLGEYFRNFISSIFVDLLNRNYVDVTEELSDYIFNLNGAYRTYSEN